MKLLILINLLWVFHYFFPYAIHSLNEMTVLHSKSRNFVRMTKQIQSIYQSVNEFHQISIFNHHIYLQYVLAHTQANGPKFLPTQRCQAMTLNSKKLERVVELELIFHF